MGNQEVCHPPYKHRKTIPPAPPSILRQSITIRTLWCMTDTTFMHPTCYSQILFIVVWRRSGWLRYFDERSARMCPWVCEKCTP